ncbi:MAG: hypothetical protein COV57_01910 [Candidatus Liptonbacteria bacterium CG11_big_fil_rev_8_21_14_0_20_35_14]|uniref:DUF5667 domain-containing protein n=1 Tax=Candidatus Liptonbacteria bacterium CG11_big_fil_rev_8_21_14_0_20_35_14 TaxID=1974634 RepID=A0A2H0N7N8_9BACT|nr:MAG: hypothetical protein COV57_01910 [Candidatus Liptonbacteria bacterium CG11_big_fil_rev_8_21_14_0_20_35_14]
MRYLYILFILAIALPLSALAQEGGRLPQAEIRLERREEIKSRAIQDKNVFREKLQNSGENKKEIMMERGEVLKKNILENRVESRNIIKKNKDETREFRVQSRESLKNELRDKISDDKKAEAVLRFSVQVDEINEKMINKFNKAVDSLEEFLARMQSRANKAVSQGLDTFAFDVVFADAQEAVLTARGAIETQSQMVYTVNVNSEETLREDVLASKERFRSDLRVVRDSIDSAKQAVRNALLGLKSVPSVNEAEVE